MIIAGGIPESLIQQFPHGGFPKLPQFPDRLGRVISFNGAQIMAEIFQGQLAGILLRTVVPEVGDDIIHHLNLLRATGLGGAGKILPLFLRGQFRTFLLKKEGLTGVVIFYHESRTLMRKVPPDIPGRGEIAFDAEMMAANNEFRCANSERVRPVFLLPLGKRSRHCVVFLRSGIPWDCRALRACKVGGQFFQYNVHDLCAEFCLSALFQGLAAKKVDPVLFTFASYCRPITRENGIICDCFVLRGSNYSIPPVKTFSGFSLAKVMPSEGGRGERLWSEYFSP